MSEEINYGLDVGMQEQAEDPENDFVFGAKKLIGLAEGIDFEKYLPKGEVQRGEKGDWMDCASRGPHNIIETKMNYLFRNSIISEDNKKWLIDKDYVVSDEHGYINGIEISDRFTAIKSGTRTSGNSLKAPVHSTYKNGVIPKTMLPADPSMTWNQYHDPSKITKEMEELGLEFLKRFPISYEKIPGPELNEALKTDMPDIAVHAWSTPQNGIYPRIDRRFNHVVAAFGELFYKIFDNYLDRGVKDDFIKQLADDYAIYPTSYRIVINEINYEGGQVEVKFKIEQKFFERLKKYLKRLGINI